MTTVLAIGTGLAILAWIGLILGLVVAGLVVALFNRTMRPLLEINEYAKDILAGGIGIARGVDGLDRLARTRELASGMPDLVNSYSRRRG